MSEVTILSPEEIISGFEAGETRANVGVMVAFRKNGEFLALEMSASNESLANLSIGQLEESHLRFRNEVIEKFKIQVGDMNTFFMNYQKFTVISEAEEDFSDFLDVAKTRQGPETLAGAMMARGFVKIVESCGDFI